VTAASIGVAGNYSIAGNLTFAPTPQIHTAPTPDPLASRQGPAVGSATQEAVTNSSAYSVSGNGQTVTIAPAVYSSGISIAGNSAIVTFTGGTYGNHINITGNSASVTFDPGQYQHTGTGDSIDISGNATTTFNPGAYTFVGSVNIVGNNTVTLQPGTYFGGIAITGQANVTFSPGTYILAGGGLSVTGNSTLTGTGVTFYNTSATGYAYGPIDMNGNETANLSAPTSGAMEGLLFFQDRSIAAGSAASTVIGNAATTFDGVVYFPTTALKFLGNSSTTGYTFLVADTISIIGQQNMTLGSNYSSLTDGSPIQSSALYE
jgi:urease beta subunit